MSSAAENRRLGARGIAELERRGLDPELAARIGVFTGRNKRNEESGESYVAPADGGNILVFPRFDVEGREIGQKYRQPPKKFWQSKGTGNRWFYGAECLRDPALSREQNAVPLVIVEGEYDRLTAIQCGFPLTVSPPDGAPPPPDPNKPREREEREQDDSTGKFEFMYLARLELAAIKRFIIAVDNDAPGKHLESEIVRRLGPARCSFVEYPAGCKDLNDVLMQHGEGEVARVLNSARPYPVHGLFRLEDYPDRPRIQCFASGWADFDQHFQIFPGANVVVTGIPSHGKSTWVLNWLTNLSERYGWRHAVISPEMPVVPSLRDKMRRQYLRSQIYERDGMFSVGRDFIARADGFINENFVFIEPDPAAGEDDELSVDWVLGKAGDALLRYGVNTLFIDPWNELEHALERGMTETQYINRNLRKINRWGKRHGVATIIAAHPTKEVGKEGKARRPTPYDIDGGAHWYNKPDGVIVIHRPDAAVAESEVYVAKVRHDETGKKGGLRLSFDKASQRYSAIDGSTEFTL